jgi:hypothetical protein
MYVLAIWGKKRMVARRRVVIALGAGASGTPGMFKATAAEAARIMELM